MVRIDESESCGNRRGRGVLGAVRTDGTASHVVCPSCSGAGKLREVVWR